MTHYQKETPESIQALFSSIAARYDRGNAVLSLGLYKLWNHALVKAVSASSKNATLLDLCAGTGDIAFDALKSRYNIEKAILIDFCAEMLECAKEKAHHHNRLKKEVDYVVGDAQQIPLPDKSVDLVTTAYGIRNVKDRSLCAKEVRRVLREGGRWGILELTKPSLTPLRIMHQLYLKTVLPVMGKLVASNRQAYEYLSNSIQHFIAPDALAKEIAQAGFQQVRIIPLMGGVATIVLAE